MIDLAVCVVGGGVEFVVVVVGGCCLLVKFLVCWCVGGGRFV